MTDTQQSILLDAPKEVDVSAIEQELIRLWKQSGDEPASGGAPVVRACSLNFVVLTEGKDRSSALEDIVSQITVDHPSRIFLISTDRSSPKSGIDAWVSARCSLPVPGGKQVCCEEINIAVSGDEIDKVPSVVTSLLVPDIPTILLWKARLDAGDNILRMLVGLSERVLIDSSEECRPEVHLLEWSRFLGRNSGRSAFGDLAWTHLTPWRALLAQTFQPVEARQHLRSLDRVEIGSSSTFIPMHSGLSQAYLLTAWLGHALRWTLVRPFADSGKGTLAATFEAGDRTIEVRCVEEDVKDDHPGGIESIALHSDRGAEILLRSLEKKGCVLVRTSWPESGSAEAVRCGHHRTEAELVSKELEIFSSDPLYESTMAMLATILGKDLQ